MTNITWEDADLYAYLDEELNARRAEALESALKQNKDLRQRLDELRLTLTLMQDTPLREAPRNYLLTPSMVKETAPEPAPERRRPLLFAMRLATTLSALAFVVMIGLQVNVSLAPRPDTMTEEAMLVERRLETEKPLEEQEEVAMMEAPAEEAPMEEPAPTEEPALTPTAAAEEMAVEEATEEPEESEMEETGAAPAWDESEGGAPQGLGGGEITGEAPPDEDVGICGVGDESEECAGEIEEAGAVVGEEAVGSEVKPVPTVVAEATEEPAPQPEVPVKAPVRSHPSWQLWLAIVFGFTTVVFGVVTWWLTRRGS